MANDTSVQTACVRTPKFYIWAREALFLDTCYARQEPHRSTQEKLILSLKGSLKVRGKHGRRVDVRSCLLPTGLLHEPSVIDASEAVLAIYYLAPFSQDYAALSSLMKAAIPGVYYGHPREGDAIRACIDVRNQKHVPPAEARKALRSHLFPDGIGDGVYREFDPRVVFVARRIRESMFEKMPLAQLAAEVQLSESRLEKLFKEQAGLPITQYRMRYRVFISTILMALGYSMTDAALYAGFSSSAHLSRVYRTINGMTPSAVFLRPPYLDPVIDDSAMQLVAPLLGKKLAG